MSNPQSLFGVKTQFQFGKLFITAALASQKSQQQSLALQGGGLSQTINKELDDYEENRHFLLAQYFKQNYNKAMSNLPFANSQVQVMRMEVWVVADIGIDVQVGIHVEIQATILTRIFGQCRVFDHCRDRPHGRNTFGRQPPT